ncbi:MBL fold metallo-hydrolase [Vallitalea guaymasensis]|uniref:MBL fold metallo-hydrolase n=1 Tax=Vallitalea guaymasensis TaxID=1185412 RepID=UPI0023536749|nr:MBL fold metallo-hydrolase [Vallitalea guaymasensis]
MKLSATMCYLIPVKNKYLLIDTGYEKDKALFYGNLSNLNISIKDIDYVLLTHHHDDHAGLINEIKTCNKSCKIIMHEKCVALVAKGKNDMPSGCGYINRRVNMTIKIFKKLNKEWDFAFPAYRVDNNDIIINEDTTLREIGIDIPGKIIYTPGHTVDSISLLLDDGICIVGDAAANMMNFMGTRYCVIFITDLKQYYQSWEKLIKENVKTIYPAHGEIFGIEKLKKNIYKNKKEHMVEV